MPSLWDCYQQLTRESEQGGEQTAALLFRKVSPDHTDESRYLAYCLYDICASKRRNAGEAASYHGLIAIWLELTRQTVAIHDTYGDPRGPLRL